MPEKAPTDVIERINYVRRALMDTCDAPFQVYIESFLAAGWRALQQLYAFDLAQIVTGFVGATWFSRAGRASTGPASGGRAAHARGRGGKRGGAPRTWLSRARQWLNWDPYDAMGRNTAGWLDLGPSNPPLGAAALWTVFGILERALWIVLIIDVVSEFIYNFAAGIYESEACQANRTPWLFADGPDQTASGLLEVWPIGCPAIHKQRGPLGWNIFGGFIGNGGGQCIFSAGIEPTSIPPPPGWSGRCVVIHEATGQLFKGNIVQDQAGTSTINVPLISGDAYSIGVEITPHSISGSGLVTGPQVTLIGNRPTPI